MVKRTNKKQTDSGITLNRRWRVKLSNYFILIFLPSAYNLWFRGSGIGVMKQFGNYSLKNIKIRKNHDKRMKRPVRIKRKSTWLRKTKQ